MQKHLRLLLGATVAACAIVASALILLRPHGAGPSAESIAFRQERGPDGKLPVLWSAPDFSYPDQHGKKTTLADLDGHVTIVDFVFTQCVTVCPRITATMVLLQRRIPDANLRFVSFSVDPEHDTPAVLAEYAKKWNARETRWILLSTEEKALAETARGMRVGLERSDADKNPIRHSSLFFLLDAQHQVRGIYGSDDDAAVQRLMKDAHELAGGTLEVPRRAVAEDASGEEIYSAFGCGACHTDDELAPSLAGIRGRDVKLEGGGHVTANDAYITESIVAPGEKVVAGFLRLMPSYAGELSPEQLTRLVAYVGALPAMEAAQPAPGEDAANFDVDPVCGMKVRVTAETRSFEHAGKTFHFCSDQCKKQFASEPAKYDRR